MTSWAYMLTDLFFDINAKEIRKLADSHFDERCRILILQHVDKKREMETPKSADVTVKLNEVMRYAPGCLFNHVCMRIVMAV